MSQKPRLLRRWMTFMLALSLLLSMAALPIQAETGDGSTTAELPTCVPFSQWQEGVALKSPLAYGQVEFYATTLQVGNLDGAGSPELTFTGQTKIFLPVSTSVKMEIVQYGQPLTIVAYDAADNEISRSVARSIEGAPQAVELVIPGGIKKVMLLPGAGRYGLNSLCYTTAANVVRGEPDLTVAVTGPTRVVQGDSVEVAVRVRNLGNGIASGSQTAGQSGYRVEVGFSKDDRIPMKAAQATEEFTEDMLLKLIVPTYDVPVGGVYDYKATVKIPANTPPGAYCLSGSVDPYGVVQEANEQNNTACDRMEVLAKGQTVTDTSGLRWIDFRQQTMGTRGEQFTAGLAKFYAPNGGRVIDLNADGYNELHFTGGKLEVTLPQSSQVSATLTHYGSPVTMQALYLGKVIATKQTGNTDGNNDTLTISAEAIDTVVFTTPTGSQGALSQLGFLAPDVSEDACDPRVSAISTGYGHSLAILKDGTVWAWGLGNTGQLGNNQLTNSFEPVQVNGLRGVVAVAAARAHSLALKNDGTVWAWGTNAGGQIGDGTSFTRATPVQVPGLSDVLAIAAGYRFSLALQADGTVWAWGENTFGQLGDGTTETRSKPVQVKGLTDVKAIAAGANYALAIKKDGSLYAWGANESGQLGDGTTSHRLTPVKVSAISDVEQVTGGLDHTLALKRDHTVWAWGGNYYGQLGDGTTDMRTTPRQITGMPAALSVAAGEAVSYAIRQDGTVWGWGYNASGQLGDGTTNSRTSPAQIQGLTNVLKLATGQGSHMLALNSEGRLWAWGSNSTGQTSLLFSDPMAEKPVQVNLKLSLLFCPIAQQPPVEEEPEVTAPANPADAWKCTQASFTDVPASHPACGAIRMLVQARVVDGYADGTFKPGADINRAAMAKLLVAALKLKANPSGTVLFTDTNKHWAVTQGWLQTAVANNIVGGYPDKTFRPDLPVNRAAAIKMAAGALNIPRVDGKAIPELRAPANPPTAHLKDVKAGDWFYDPVVLSLRADLIGPAAPFPLFTANQFAPETNLTRGEAAILIANLLFFRER